MTLVYNVCWDVTQKNVRNATLGSGMINAVISGNSQHDI